MKYLKLILFVPLLFCISAKANAQSSYVVMEATSNRIIEASNENESLLIASTTKIMTAIVSIENYDLDEKITFEKEDVNAEGSKVYLDEKDSMTRKDLLYALLLRSGNDAASALSKQDSFQFIYLMNEYAKKIGMVNSVFVNASGLDETTYNLSTACDMARLMIYCMKNKVFSEICGAKNYQTSSTNGKKYSFINKHKLILSGDVLAGKTGYTTSSKRVLVSYFERNNTEFACVTINDSNDWNHHKNLISGTDAYEYKTICKSGIYTTKFDVDFYIYVPKDIVLPVKKSEKRIELVFLVQSYKVTLYIYANDTLIATCDMNTTPIG